MRFAIALAVVLLSLVSQAQAANRYSVASARWDVTTTWSTACGGASGSSVPVAADSAFICPGTTVEVRSNVSVTNITAQNTGVLNIGQTGNNTARILTISGTLTIDSGGIVRTNTTSNTTHTLAMTGGNIVNNGTFNMAADIDSLCNVTFSFNGSQTVSGSGGITQFDRITLNMGTTRANILDYTATALTFAVTTTSGITITNGSFRLSSAVTIAPFDNGPLLANPNYYVIPATGRFWLNNAGATVNVFLSVVTANLSLDGELRIDAGTMNLGDAADERLRIRNTTGNTARLEVNGGALNIAGRLGTVTATDNGTYVQTGGTLTVGTVGNGTTTFGPFFLGSAMTFNMSGGTIAIQRASTAATTNEYDNRAAISAVTGGTVQFGNASTPTLQVIEVASTPALPNVLINATNSPNVTAMTNLNVIGNWTNNATFTPGALTVTFSGAAATLGGTNATTFNNLTVNMTAGSNITIACGTPSPTVNATLALTSGDIVTSGTSPACATTCATQVPLIVGATGTITGGSATSYVQGALRKMFSATGTLNFRATAGQDEFPVGDTINYTPVEITAGTTSTAGSMTACVTPTDHPQVTTPVVTTGINAAKSVNRYWSLTTSTINTTAVLVDATFKFVAGDVDAGAVTGNFVAEDFGTYWRPTTLVTAAATSTRVQNLDLTPSTNNDIAIGEPLAGFTAQPGRYNVFETATTIGAIIGKIQTKVAGSGFQVDVVNINANKTGVQATSITVEVRLLDSSGGGVLDANGCNVTWPLIQSLPSFLIPASGRGTIPTATVANSYRSVRFQIRSPVGGPYTQIGCSTDLFAIRPASLSITAHDATWATAGTTRQLANTAASSGNVHKAATSVSPLPFTLRATPLPATATNYDGNPTTVTGFPTCGTLCTTVGALSYTAGSWMAAGSGVRENATANYSEAGTFNLQLEDATYASVDTVDGTPLATLTVPATASEQIGRFVPDHFDVTGSNTPVFKTFNVADGVCRTPPSGPKRSFTYIGQPFGYLTGPGVTAPAGTILARNAAGATTVNYTGSLWKLSGTSNAAKDCTTASNICKFTTSFTGTGIVSSVVSSYTYALTPASTPGWDNAAAVADVMAVTPGVGTGTGTFVVSSSDSLAFLRNPATPQPSFTAAITNTFSVTDSSEVAGDANNGTIATTTPLVFNGSGSGIAFDAGNEFRYGRLRLLNAYGSELLDLPMSLAAQYWNGTAFVTNTADSCMTLNVANILLGNYQGGITAANMKPGAPATGNVSFTGPLASGMGTLNLIKPFPTPVSRGSVDVTVDLGAGGENKLYMQGSWTGATYTQNPASRATFGIFKSPLIYRRENY